MINCINYSHPKVKALVEAVGKDKTIDIFIENDFSIPDDITQYLDESSEVKPGVAELFDSNPELANVVYEAAGLINTSEIQLDKPIFNPDNAEAISYPIKINNKYAGVISVDKDGYISSSIGMAGVELEKEFQGKGYGTKVYIALAEQLAKEGKTLKSEAFGKTDINESANRVWKSLLDKSYAVDKGSYFEVQLKDKQQALQLYSQYLDTIFPDSKVKDIVYRGGEGGISEEQYYTLQKNYAERYGKAIPSILNLSNPVISNRGIHRSWVKDELTDRGIIGKDYPGSTSDAIIEQMNGDKPFSAKGEFDVYVIKNKNQKYLLGSKQDIEGFKEFVEKQTKPKDAVLSLETEIYLPENLKSRNAALEQAKILTNKYPNYVFTVRGETEFGETTYSVEKVKKKPSVTTKVIEAMSRKMGLKFMYISERDLNNFNVPSDTNSFVQGKTVYLVKERVNDLIAVEEFLHPFVKNLQINNPTLFYKLLDDAKQIPVFQDLIKDIENTYGKIPGYDIENEIVTQVLSDRVLTNFQNNGMEETPIEKIAPFADSVNKALSYIANSIVKLLNELGFNIIPAKALNDFSTIRSMAALINTAGTKFETAEVGTMLNLTDGQKQSIDMFDDLESKVSMNNDSEYVVEGYDNKWQRPSQLSKGVINQKDIEGAESEQYKEAGNRFHEFAKDIIRRAFPDANRHNTPISLDVSELKYYNELEQFLNEHVINPAKKDGAVLRAETFVANEDLNIAGRIDLLRINKDGSYQVYDLKTRYRKEQTGKKRINKILEWTKQTGFYKQLLSTPNKVGTPIGKVNSVKVIELEGSQYEGEIKSIKNIGFVASKEEKTGLAQLDDLISKLYNQIDIMKSNTPTSDVQKIAHEKLLTSRIELVQSLQLKKDYEALISHVSQELFILDDLITSGEVEKNAQVIMSDLKLYSMLSKFLEDSELSKEQINQLYVLQGKSVSLLAKFEAAAREKIKEESKRVGILGKLTDDLFQAVKDIGGIYKNLSGASTLDSPIVQTALRVINERRNKAVIKSKEAYEKIKESVDNLKKQLGTLDYSLFVNSEDNKNFLVDKYQYEFFKEAGKNKNNLQWFAENATFDKEKYEKAYNNFINYLDRFEAAKKAEIKENAIQKEGIEDVDKYTNAVYEKYRKDELAKWVAKNKSIVEYHVPKDQWIDPKWKDIKEGKYKGTAVEEFYDMYKRFLDEARDIAPDYLSPRFIPNFSASFVEKASNLGVIGGLNESWSNLLTELNTSYDPSYGLKDALTGEPIRALNIPGINNQVDTQSLDLGLSMQMFMEGVYKYKELSEIEETVFMAKHFLRSGKILKTEFLTGKTSEESAMKSNLADSFDGYVDAVLYGVQKENTGGFKVTGGKGLLGKPATLAGLLPEGDTVMVSWAKLADKLLKYTSLKNLGFNIFSPITNLLAGTGNMYATGFGDRYYSTGDLTWAITAVTSNDLTEEGKLANAIYKELDLNSKEIQFRNNELSKYVGDKMLEKYNGMTMMRLSEEALHKSVVLAMLKSNKYNIKLSDFKLENGKLIMANEANNSLTRSLFKAKTTRVSQLVFGAMNDDDFLLANKSVIGRMLIQHRSWLPQMFMERWGSKRFDYNLEMEMEGRYRTLGRVVGHLISKQKVGNLTELEKYNLKAAGMELSLVIAIGLLLKALAAGLDDDDKKESWYKFTTLVGQRTLSELGFFVDVSTKSQFQILLSPAASISVYEDYGRFVNALWKETTGDEKERKKAKPLKAAGKLVPVVGQLQRFIDELFNINLSTFDETPKED